MSVFIMVAGVFTGTHVWQETAERLAAAGSEVHAVALTGVDAGRPAASAEVDLETHIADVIAVIDAVDATSGREIVLVGHDYGIHPVLGAADRRPQRVARVVYLDSGMPQNGVPALAAVPDQALRARLAERAQRGETEGSWRRPPVTSGRDGAVPPTSATRLWTGSPPLPRRSRWAPCSSRCG